MKSESIDRVDAILLTLNKHSAEAKVRFALVRPMPKSLPLECRAIWADVGFSFTFERFYAALCVCGAFVECFLERAIPVMQERAGGAATKLPESLYELIKKAVEVGVASPEDGELLQLFRKLVRIKFAHGDVDPVANSLWSIAAIKEVTVSDGQYKMRDWTDDEMSVVRGETVGDRLQYAQQAYAMKVIPWIGIWASDTARRVFDPTTSPTADAP
jgi:hypothetical protein